MFFAKILLLWRRLYSLNFVILNLFQNLIIQVYNYYENLKRIFANALKYYYKE